MSNIYDKSSLVLIPSGTKTGKVYSQKPVSGDGDFTFTRSSAATRVNADGFIEKETENKLLQSNDFANASWAKIRSSVTSGQTGYDGSSNAWKLESTDAADSYVGQGVSQSGVQTFSVYAKSGNVDYIYFRIAGTTSQGSYINLSDGSVSSSFNPSNIIGGTNVTDVGNGWYKISIAVSTTTSDVRFYVSDSGVATSAIGSFIYIQDAQLEQGLVARDYIETTTTAVEGGITDNVPRLDYTDSSCPALLLEPQRTNLALTSEYAGGSGWFVNSNYSVNHNTAISPEGVQNAFELTIPSANGNIRAIISVTPSTEYTFSFYVKRGTATELKYSVFNLINGTNIVAPTSYYSQTSATEWKRIEVTFTAPSGCTSAGVYIDRDSQGDGTAFFYGIQCEAGSYATSYIPTYGSSVTRTQDNTLNSSAASIIGQTEGSIYAEVDFKAIGEESRFVQLSDGTNSNRFLVGSTSSNGVQIYVVSGGVVQWTPATTPYVDGVIKVAVAYKNNDYAMYVNGTQINTSSSSSVPAMDEISVGYNSIVGNRPTAYGHRKVMLFKTRLSNEELAALTTI